MYKVLRHKVSAPNLIKQSSSSSNSFPRRLLDVRLPQHVPFCPTCDQSLHTLSTSSVKRVCGRPRLISWAPLNNLFGTSIISYSCYVICLAPLHVRYSLYYIYNFVFCRITWFVLLSLKLALNMDRSTAR